MLNLKQYENAGLEIHEALTSGNLEGIDANNNPAFFVLVDDIWVYPTSQDVDRTKSTMTTDDFVTGLCVALAKANKTVIDDQYKAEIKLLAAQTRIHGLDYKRKGIMNKACELIESGSATEDEMSGKCRDAVQAEADYRNHRSSILGLSASLVAIECEKGVN